MMRRRKLLIAVVVLVATAIAFGQTTNSTGSAPASAPTATPVNPQAEAPQTQESPAAAAPAGGQAENTGAAPLRVMVGKSLLINTTERLIRVSVTDPAVADAMVVTPTQILIHGRAPGEVSLLICGEME